MTNRLPFIFHLSALLWVPNLLNAQTDFKLESVTKIWDKAPHNAFTDLIRYKDEWVCAFREAPAHAGGVKGSSIRIITSDDGKSWKSSAIMDDPRGDIRDAKMAVTPEGNLMMLTATQFFDTSKQRHQSHAWFTNDLESWDGPHDVGDADIWAWGIQFHQGLGYSIGYRTVEPRFVRLYTTKTGKKFDSHVAKLDVVNRYPNESVFVFDDQDFAYCLLRCQGPAQIGVAKPPYKKWTWKDTGVAIGGPEMIQLPDGRLLGGGRLYDGGARTSLFWVDPQSAKITEVLKLPSGGDTSYPGFVFHDGKLYVSYYSSHEGKSCIYFATIDIALKDKDQQQETQPIDIANRLEPFVDDYLVDQLSGSAELRLHSPVDREIVIKHDRPWEGNTSAYHTVFHDGEKYRMYYRASHAASYGSGIIKDHPEFTCYAESADGINWTRPNLGLFQFNGSTDNNIILANDPATHDFAPFLDSNPGASPDAKFKAIGRGKGGLFVYKSPDGIRWQRLHNQPVITEGAFDSLNVAFYDSFRNRYVDFHRDFRNGVRDIKTAYSQDFLHWSKPEWLSYPGVPPEHLYTNGIVAYHRAPHLFVGLAKRYVPGRNPAQHPASGVSDAVFMTSRDGFKFHRWKEAVVRPGLQASRWVNRNNLPAWGIVETTSTTPGGPNELSIYTTGDYYAGGGVTLRRHTWRLDGFVSIHANGDGGDMVTVPFTFASADENQHPATNKPFEQPASIQVIQDDSAHANKMLHVKSPAIIEIPESKSLGKQVTLAAMVRNVPPGRRRLFSTYNGGSSVPGELFFDFDSDSDIGNGIALRFRYDKYGVNVPSTALSDWSTDGNWHHLAAVWDDGQISVYFDGKLVGQGGQPGAGELNSNLGNLRFGEDYPPTSQANEPFLGYVDDILVLRKTLTAKQVLAVAKRRGIENLNIGSVQGSLYDIESGEQPFTDQLATDGKQDGKPLLVSEPSAVIRGKTELVLNLSTSAAGSVKVELQHPSGQPIEGYTFSDCDELIGDAIAMPVSWKKSTEVSSLAGKPIRIRFLLKDADLYSMRFQSGEKHQEK